MMLALWEQRCLHSKVADSAAMYFLFPGPDNQQAFETTRNLLQDIIEQEERWG